ncbi:MATE family efflux transporter [Fulvivirgaceae bacterium BMA12]|uniref:MATE family efflux transporter n=1 Tax=Agaribacillus aureus TaxID=3051825 RepID=A0ABT8L2B2_9BACT|nr:MATE family efflux transporter [Fulvivirgaceae bacterium BMA12]
MSRQPDLRKDSPWKLMRKLSLPGILGMMVLSINSLVDSVYLGNLVSAEGFAGVSLLFPITLIVSSATGFIAAGSSSVLSRAIGAANKSIQRKVIPNLLALSLISSVIMTLLGLLLADEAVSFMGAEGAVYQAGVEYLKVYAFGVVFSIYGLAANGLIRSEGRIRQAMTYTVTAVVINIIFTPIFIDLLGLGIAGAAWSSIASMLVYCVLTTLYFIRGKASFETGAFAIRIEKDIIRDVASVGFSALTMQLSNVLRQFIAFRSITWYGSAHDLVVFSAIFRLFSFVAVPSMGLLRPLQPVVGVNFGAFELKRCIQAVKTFRLAGISLMCLLLLPLMLFPGTFIGFMIPDAPVTNEELNYLRFVLVALPFLPVSTSAMIFFQAIGEGKKATLLSLGRQLILFIPLILLIPYFKGIDGIYQALVIENISVAASLWLLLALKMQKFQQGAPLPSS